MELNTWHLRWGGGSDEELSAVGVRSGIGHAKQASLGVLELEVLIWELLAVDWAKSANANRNLESTYLTLHQCRLPW